MEEKSEDWKEGVGRNKNAPPPVFRLGGAPRDYAACCRPVPTPTKGIEGLDENHPHLSISLAASSARVHLLPTFFQRSALEGAERTEGPKQITSPEFWMLGFESQHPAQPPHTLELNDSRQLHPELPALPSVIGTCGLMRYKPDNVYPDSSIASLPA